jgi:hypothetical protein
MLLLLLLPAAVDVDAPNPDVSRNHDVPDFVDSGLVLKAKARPM